MIHTLGKITIVFLLLVGLQAPIFSFAPTVQAQAEDGSEGEKGDKGEKGEGGDSGQAGLSSNEEPAQDGESGQVGDNGEDGGDGEEGEDGENAGETSNGGDGNASIETGDASSTGQINNTGNSNTINSCVKTDKSEGKGEKDEKGEEEEECASGGSGDTEIENNNTAEAGNEADIQANTGDNEASGNNGSSTIDTGDAVAVLDLFNLINTNIIDSNGLFVLLSNLQAQLLDMDLRDWMPYLKEYNPECGESCYSLHDLEILNQNLANITNNVNVTANTGGNEASDNSGEGNITTGDAYAAANIINIANTNIIDSNYLLFIANNFGNFFGDIVFPNASSFFTSMFSSPSQVYSEVEINNTNTASISNNVAASAETGENEANGNGNSVIQTGDANSAANVFNQANMNLFGGNSFVALIRVSGDWSGNVFGLPEGIAWQQTPNGIMLYSDDLTFEPESAGQENVSCGDCEKEEGAKGKSGGKGSKEEHSELSVTNTNNATINNNVQVFALTGDNEANGNGKGGKIETGNAQAIANVVNVANTNVIGANWLFAMFNILGDFEGNISFGRPNLWIGQRAEIPNDPALPGDPVTYYLTIVNNGDIPAHNVTVTSIFDHPLFAFGSSAHQHTSPNEQEFVWDIGTLNPGAGMEISFSGNIKSDIPFGTFAFTNTSSVQATESDDDAKDNSDAVELLVHNEEPASTGGGGGTSGGSGGSGGGSGSGGSATTANTSSQNDSSNKPNLKVTKTYAHEGDVYPGNEVDYTVVIMNDGGGSAYDAFLVDVLESEDGEVVHEEEWDLGEVFPDEEIIITYSVVFESDAKPGLYYNEAWVDAENGFSNTATTSIQLQSAREVLLSVEEELSKIAGELNIIGGNALAIAGEPEEEFEQFADISEIPEQTEELPQERSPFLASLAGLLQGFGPWASALAAGSFLFLFFLLKRRRRESAQ
ncbi:MAG TPA: hypothetical protein VGA53_00850 [Candidatus Paceibacterota bacterium]